VFLVTEALGPTGIAAVDWLAGRGCSVRAAVPDAGKFLRQKKVDPIRFDWSEPEGWESALSGIEGLVLICPTDLVDMETRVCDFLAAASEAGCRRVSFLSAAEAESDRWVPHRKIEDNLRNSGMSWTFLRAGVAAQTLIERRRTGIASLELTVPVGVGSVAWVDSRDVGEAAARVLLDEIWDQRAPVLTGPRAVDIEEVCQILSSEAETRVVCTSCSMLRYAARWRFQQGLTLRQCLDRIRGNRRICADRSAHVSDDLRLLLGRAPRGLDDFVRDHRQYFHVDFESPETPSPLLATKPRKSKRRATACEV